MDIGQFWELIEKTHLTSKDDPDKQADLLVAELTNLSEKEILAYQAILDDLEDEAYIAELWDIAGIMACGWGCSEDGFMDFRAWLIGQGRNVFEKALAEPESLVDIVAVGQETQCEALLYVAMRAYETRTGKDPETMPNRVKSPPELKGTLLVDRASTLARFPEAAAKYMKC